QSRATELRGDLVEHRRGREIGAQLRPRPDDATSELIGHRPRDLRRQSRFTRSAWPPQCDDLAAFGRKLFPQTFDQVASILVAASDEAHARRARDGWWQKAGFADALSLSPGHLFNRFSDSLRDVQPRLVAVRP